MQTVWDGLLFSRDESGVMGFEKSLQGGEPSHPIRPVPRCLSLPEAVTFQEHHNAPSTLRGQRAKRPLLEGAVTAQTIWAAVSPLPFIQSVLSSRMDSRTSILYSSQ